jgi:hypothetical protein
MSRQKSAFLLVLGEREALAWVLDTEQMAFTSNRSREAAALQPGDRLLLYTTRACFHNPRRDRGRVIGEATVESEVKTLERQVELSGRRFITGCRISIRRLAPARQGVEIAPLVPKLQAFPDPASWSARMRRPLVTLPHADMRLLLTKLEQVATDDPASVIDNYRALAG